MCVEVKRDVPVAAAIGCVVAAKLLAPALAFVPMLVAAEAVVAVAWIAWIVRLVRPRRQPAAAPARVPARAAVTTGQRALPASQPRYVMLGKSEYQEVRR